MILTVARSALFFYRRTIEALIANPDIDLTLVHSQKMPDEPIYQNPRVREVIIPLMKLPLGSHFFSFLRYCLTTKDEFDLVHSFKVRLYPFFWLFPARKRLIMAHGGGERLAPGRWTLMRYFFVWNLIIFQKHIDGLIAVSEYANKEIIYAFRVPPEKVFTLYPNNDETYDIIPNDQEVRTVLNTYKLEPKSYFVFIGRFRVHKNVGYIAESYLRYREKNSNAKEILVLAGGSYEQFEHEFGPLRDSPYKKDIIFLGYIPTEHMSIFYKGAKALAFTTLNEGFGVPITEAFACGTPVITSSVTSMPEVAGGAALIVDPHNPDALAEAFRMISTDEKLCEELVRRGLERNTFFTWDKAVARTFEIYGELLDAKPLVFNPVANKN
jgi:glycosyltransferase involved in cell wall biosynthesis